MTNVMCVICASYYVVRVAKVLHYFVLSSSLSFIQSCSSLNTFLSNEQFFVAFKSNGNVEISNGIC